MSHGPGKAERDVVQVIAGYRYKPQSDVSLTIDGKALNCLPLKTVLMRKVKRMTDASLR